MLCSADTPVRAAESRRSRPIAGLDRNHRGSSGHAVPARHSHSGTAARDLFKMIAFLGGAAFQRCDKVDLKRRLYRVEC